MIAGTIVVEEKAVTFRHTHVGVEVTVQDSLTGAEAQRNVTLGEWAATLALLIGGGELGEAEGPLYELAERAQPTREHLIDCCEWVGEDELEAAVNALRLIP